MSGIPPIPRPEAPEAPARVPWPGARESTLVPSAETVDSPGPPDARLMAGGRTDARRAPGVRLGSFELVRLLGEGATGEVWEAIDRRYGAPVALKLFDEPAGRSPAMMDRVLTEARAASRIVSDYVVYIRDAGRIDPPGVPYIAMALCREDVHDHAEVASNLCEDGPRTLGEAARWGEQIARGVAAAHAQGVYHRDMKPDNVLCLPRSRNVRIVDFGLSPLAGGASRRPRTASRTLLSSGDDQRVIAGTPGYMAPEQARGFSRAPDADRDAELLTKLDVYGVGATLWGLLAGRSPHAAADDRSTPERIVARAASTPPPSLEAQRGRFRVPRRLARIVERAMAENPEDRYPSASALARDLGRWRANLPTSLDAAASPMRPILWLRRHPMMALTFAWVFAVAIATLKVGGQLDAAYSELERVEGRLSVTERAAVQEGQRADDAESQAQAQSQRAETAEERAARVAAVAARQKDRAEEGEALAEQQRLRADSAEAVAEQQRARAEAAEALAVQQGERATIAESLAATQGERAANAEALASREGQRADAAIDRTIAAERAAERAEARAVAERARADDADAEARAARTRAEHAEARARAAEAQARTAEAQARAAVLRADDAGGEATLGVGAAAGAPTGR